MMIYEDPLHLSLSGTILILHMYFNKQIFVILNFTANLNPDYIFSHYDDPRRELEREEAYRRLARRNQDDQRPSLITSDRSIARTLGDRIESGATGVSPLQGAKVVVSNLQSSVSQEDILELFGDIGALKRAKVSEPGTAEVTFVNRSDALKAVEIYHNRQLDGKAMRCTLVGDGGYVKSAIVRRPR